MTWMEALPPLVIITVALAGMGTLQDAVHRVAYKEGKKVQRDRFSSLMDARDATVRAEAAAVAASASSSSSSSARPSSP
ncbi:hypothetical protein I4F81_002751 [Pyropia yezoensis]|uniref:Uncharacterized protein n=1 Tax=Pyropia yezoensis TaxID=2788 RepID=A0ACC3BQI8_PYRYE|nr:hypothetical protein I4F81_002751 [Neopyropia yezoensis]